MNFFESNTRYIEGLVTEILLKSLGNLCTSLRDGAKLLSKSFEQLVDLLFRIGLSRTRRPPGTLWEHNAIELDGTTRGSFATL